MKTRMEHILEIVKELCKNERMVTPSHNMESDATRLITFAYLLYEQIEDMEEKITMDSRVGF